jgi:hypothetical protein
MNDNEKKLIVLFLVPLAALRCLSSTFFSLSIGDSMFSGYVPERRELYPAANNLNSSILEQEMHSAH